MIKHIFYCPFTGKTFYGDGFKSQEWYDHRVGLFTKYTIESLKNQTNKDFIFWASFRPKEIDNPTTQKIKEALENSGLKYILTFRGTMMTEDRATWHNDDLKERLEEILPILKEFVGDANYIYETNLDSDDTIHKTFSEVVIRKEFKNRGALYMRGGYAYDLSGKLAEWNNPISNQNYTIMFPADIYFDAQKRLEYLGGLKTHEEIPTLFNSEQLPDKLYCTLIHGENISTVWDNPYRGKECDKSILKDFYAT